MSLKQLRRYLGTARYLRPMQMWNQVMRRVLRPRLLPTTPLREYRVATVRLRPGVTKPESYLGATRFRFLNQALDLESPIFASSSLLPLLWQYNLHYFDYLQQPGMNWETGSALMRDWIAQHPVEAGAVGWQPYPLSLRIVNWLKFMCAHTQFTPEFVDSLNLQSENLARQIECHILGNHLFSNGKALWFAGAFLENAKWRDVGREIILDQLDEQFLPDGGHFELSPMYHALAVEDLLDLINLCHCIDDRERLAPLEKRTSRAMAWLVAMAEPGGAIPLLNDSAHGIAPACDQLRDYAQGLNIALWSLPTATMFEHGWKGRELSGYWVIENEALRVLFDTAALGPDYLPGHAHCDMLSLLLDFRGDQVLADTGVFEYAEGARRTYSRSTAAHNTVIIDAFEQGDIWKSFRMGKRGHPIGKRASTSEISCEHTGFAIWDGSLRHRRTVKLLANGVEIVDELRAGSPRTYAASFHFAPGVTIEEEQRSRFRIGNGMLFEVTGSDAAITTSEYYPEFGLIRERACLVLSGKFKGERRFSLKCTYSS